MWDVTLKKYCFFIGTQPKLVCYELHPCKANSPLWNPIFLFHAGRNSHLPSSNYFFAISSSNPFGGGYWITWIFYMNKILVRRKKDVLPNFFIVIFNMWKREGYSTNPRNHWNLFSLHLRMESLRKVFYFFNPQFTITP